MIFQTLDPKKLEYNAWVLLLWFENFKESMLLEIYSAYVLSFASVVWYIIEVAIDSFVYPM